MNLPTLGPRASLLLGLLGPYPRSIAEVSEAAGQAVALDWLIEALDARDWGDVRSKLEDLRDPRVVRRQLMRLARFGLAEQIGDSELWARIPPERWPV